MLRPRMKRGHYRVFGWRGKFFARGKRKRNRGWGRLAAGGAEKAGMDGAEDRRDGRKEERGFKI